MNPEQQGTAFDPMLQPYQPYSQQNQSVAASVFDPTSVSGAPAAPPEGQIETSLDQTEKPKASWIWMKDSSGYPSVSVTMLTVSFWVTTILFIMSSVQQIGPLTMRPFDVGASGAYFGAILALYFGRRYTDAKFNVNR